MLSVSGVIFFSGHRKAGAQDSTAFISNNNSKCMSCSKQRKPSTTHVSSVNTPFLYYIICGSARPAANHFRPTVSRNALRRNYCTFTSNHGSMQYDVIPRPGQTFSSVCSHTLHALPLSMPLHDRSFQCVSTHWDCMSPATSRGLFKISYHIYCDSSRSNGHVCLT